MAPDRIIHMNGRVYDPKLGRMLSPDPVTQAPENGQNYNRYTYAYNNPLKYTDPSGFQMEEVVVRSSGSSGCCYADWDGGYQPYNGKGNHALDLLFAATIHYNMTEGLRLKLAPGFEKLGVAEGDWFGAFAAVEAQIEGDNITSDGAVMEETLVTGQKDNGAVLDTVLGAMQVAGGSAQALLGAGLCTSGIGCLAGTPLMIHGLSNVAEGSGATESNIAEDAYVYWTQQAGGSAQLGEDIYMAADLAQAGYGIFRTVPTPLAQQMGPYAFQSEVGYAGFMTAGSMSLTVNDLFLFATTLNGRLSE